MIVALLLVLMLRSPADGLQHCESDITKPPGTEWATRDFVCRQSPWGFVYEQARYIKPQPGDWP